MAPAAKKAAPAKAVVPAKKAAVPAKKVAAPQAAAPAKDAKPAAQAAASAKKTAAKKTPAPKVPDAERTAAGARRRDPALADNWRGKKPEELSDAEVLAMSDDDYMNRTQLAFFRHRLESLRASIVNKAGQTVENLRGDMGTVADPADRATIEEEHALELRTRDRERKLLRKIDQAVALIDSGDYGYCIETGEPIGVPRLLARPTATLSLEAQERREKRQKLFGD